MTEPPVGEIPWPGPRPYEETHWRSYYGRAADTRRVISNVGASALSVLLGGSGTGKTSLVRAGVVPELRNRRYHPRGSKAQWPVLVLRRWGAESGTTVDRILHDQIKVAIEAIEEWGRSERQDLAHADVAFFRSELELVQDNDTIVDTLLRLAASVREPGEAPPRRPASGTGLVLVFDQFEELLRPGGRTASDAISVIQEIYQKGAETIHMLLSLRQEFVYALRELESTVGGLAGRSIVLSPMRQQTVLEVIRDASKTSEVQILEDAAAKVVSWLVEVAASRDGAKAHGAVGSVPSSPQLTETAATPDLLKLQAVLREVFLFARDKGKSQVDLAILEEFETATKALETNRDGQDADESQDGEDEWGAAQILDGALERWIESALAKPLTDSRAESISDVGQGGAFQALTDKLPREELHRQVRHIAIRVAPHLTALDYKVPQEENALFRLALGDDIWRLGMRNARHREKIRILDEDGKVPRLNWDFLEISEELLAGERHYLSGLARVEGWSPAETGNRLTACFRETLHRLKQGNILTRIVKDSGDRRSSVWELVHDQFGPTFQKWSHEHRETWDDCKSSFTICNGVQPIIVPGDRVTPVVPNIEYELSKVSWRGCSIEPRRRKKLVLRDVHFRDCYLVGTIFDRCRFEGGSFTGCELNGALFRDCEFIDIGTGAPVFERCDVTSLGIITSRIHGLEFSDCELQQPTIMAILDGELCFKNGSRVALAYFEVRSGGAKDAKIVFEKESRAFFCSADLGSLELINYGSQQDVASGAVPDRFFERRAKPTTKDQT
jgi:hypothetical protein